MSLYCMENSRTAEQLAEMQRLEAAGECLFCPDIIEKHLRQVVIKKTDHWIVSPNEFPYKGTSRHLLLVPLKHVSDILDLDSAAQQDFWCALAWVREEYNLTYYGLGVRNGSLEPIFLLFRGEVRAEEEDLQLAVAVDRLGELGELVAQLVQLALVAAHLEEGLGVYAGCVGHLLVVLRSRQG